jgi:hypothetical protein
VRIAYFSSGDVGAGHLVRGVAIERALARTGVRAEYRIVYGALPFATPPGVELHAVPIDRKALSDPHAAPHTELARALATFTPDVLLVDLFWAPLVHILPTLTCEAWLLVRDCHPHWLGGPFSRGFDEKRYTRVIGIEPGVPVAVRESIEPIVVCNRDECRPPRALRERFGVPDDRSLTLIAQAGAPGELELLERQGYEGTDVVVRARIDDATPLFPLAPWLPGADRIVGGAGYNLFWETRWLDLSARAELRPFARSNEDQSRRLRLARDHRMRANGADALAQMLK